MKNILDYVLLFSLVAVSGIPFFSGADILIIIIFIISFLVFMIYDFKVNKQFLIVIIVFLIVESSQIIIHGSSSLRTMLGTYVKLSMVFFITTINGKDFNRKYINIIYFFSIISLIFYSLSFIPGFTDFFIQNVTPTFEYQFERKNYFYKPAQNIIIFTFEKSLWIDFRNSGPFWEPGGFAVFLIIALILNLVRTKDIFDKKNIIFIIATLTTISTAGIIALFLTIISYLYTHKGFSKYVFILSISIVSVFAFMQLQFLGDKITQNIAIADKTTSSRFGSMLADFRDFQTSPVVGWGRGENRYGGRKYIKFIKEQHRNNGVFGLLAIYGMFLSILFFFWYYKYFKYYCMENHFSSKFAIYMLIIVLVLGFSQYIFIRPFFFSFLFFGSFLERKSNHNEFNS